jgi:hypothetical protein
MKPNNRVCIWRDGTPMTDEERKFMEAANARIQRDLREGFRKKRLEDQAKLLEAEAKAAKPKLEATVLEFPAKLSEWELLRRQQVIDQTWERVVEQRRELERMAYHRDPEDSDWNL